MTNVSYATNGAQPSIVLFRSNLISKSKYDSYFLEKYYSSSYQHLKLFYPCLLPNDLEL